MKKVKISFVGVGFFSQISHIINYYKNPRVELFEICDLDTKLAEGVKKKFGFTGKIYSDYKKMNLKDTDGFVIIVQRRLTGNIANFFLQNKCNIFTEKPHTYSSKEYINNKKFQKGVWIKGYVRRTDKAIIHFYKNFENLTKNLGRINFINFTAKNGNSYLGSKHYVKPTIKKKLKSQKSLFPKFLKKKYYNLFDVYNNSACHALDLFDFFGFSKFERIHSDISNENFFVKLNCNFKKSSIPAAIHLSSSKVDGWYEKMEFLFEKGQVIIDFKAPLDKSSSHEVKIIQHKKIRKTIKFKKFWCFNEQSKHFAEEIAKENKKSHKNSKDGINSILLYEKIWKSII